MGPYRFSLFWRLLDTNKQTNTQAKNIYTGLVGRFSPIFYFSCEYFLFVYIVKQKQKRCRFYKKIVAFRFSRLFDTNTQTNRTQCIYIDTIAVLLLLCPELNQSRYNQSTKNINQNTIHMAKIPWTINTTITGHDLVSYQCQHGH